MMELQKLMNLGSIQGRAGRSMDSAETDGRAEPSATVFGQSFQPYPVWFRCTRQPLSMVKVKKA